MDKVYEAMGHGALDAVDTPRLGPLGQVSGANDLIEKIATVGKLIGLTVGPATLHVHSGPAPTERQRLGTLVLLGASTGGPKALADILAGLPAGLEASVIIVQHVDAAFAPGLAGWLGDQTGLPRRGHHARAPARTRDDPPGRDRRPSGPDPGTLARLRPRAEAFPLPALGGRLLREHRRPLARPGRGGAPDRAWAATGPRAS